MKRRIVLSLFSLFLFQPVVRADMIEVKNEGILNGKVLSNDDKQVRFKDSRGKEHQYAKEDVLYLDTDVNVNVDMSFFEKVQKKAAEILKAVRTVPKAVKKTTDGMTEKFIGEVGKPLDRSAANAKSAALASALDQASQASAASTSKMMAFNKEVYRQRNEARESAPSSSDEKKGRFTSL